MNKIKSNLKNLGDFASWREIVPLLSGESYQDKRPTYQITVGPSEVGTAYTKLHHPINSGRIRKTIPQ